MSHCAQIGFNCTIEVCELYIPRCDVLCRNMMVSGLQEIDKQRAFVQDVQIPLDVFE